MKAADMDRLAAIKQAGRAASILMRLATKRLSDKFTISMSAINAAVDSEQGYGLVGERNTGGARDLIAEAMYTAMAPHANAAIDAARAALHDIVERGVSATKEEGR